MKRLVAVLFIVMISGTVFSKHLDPGLCPRGEFVWEKMPVLPEGKYPIRGFYLWDFYSERRDPIELVFTADPDEDGCFQKYRTPLGVAFTDLGGAHDQVLVWYVEETMHIYIPSDEVFWEQR